MISSYAGLLFLATGSVWAGAFGSLPKPPRKKGEKSSNGDEEEEEEDEERITSEDAWLFPIVSEDLRYPVSVILIVKV